MAEEIVDKLIAFAKQHHPVFADVPVIALRKMFETYQKTTLVYRVDREIRGFAIYQEWPNCLNFITIVGKSKDRLKNLKTMLAGRNQLPVKKIVFFDENKMELKILCRQQQQVGQH